MNVSAVGAGGVHGPDANARAGDECSDDGAGLASERAAQHDLHVELSKETGHPVSLTAGVKVHLGV
jgi:hypothetical protein